MPAYHSHSIDEEAFIAFVSSPQESQLDELAGCLQEDWLEPYFEDDLPVWNTNELEWATQNLKRTDWYSGLIEPEMVGWQAAIESILRRP